MDWVIENLPVQGAAAPASTLQFSRQINGGGYSAAFLTLSSNADVQAGGTSGGLTAGAYLSITSTGGDLFLGGRVRQKWPATGQLNFTNNANDTGVGLDFAVDAVLKLRTRAQSAYATMDALAYQTGGNAVGYDRTAYGAGTVYSLTNSAAAIDFGTTDPAIVLDKVGTYLIFGQVNLAYTGATVVAETATIKVRRTNNTAADLSAVVVLDLPVATTLTNTYGVFQIPPFVYTTAATDDAVTLFGNVSAGLSAGTIDATAIGTSLVAIRLY